MNCFGEGKKQDGLEISRDPAAKNPTARPRARPRSPHRRLRSVTVMPMRRLAMLVSVLGLLVLPVAGGGPRGSSGKTQRGSPIDPGGPGGDGVVTPPSGDPPPFIGHDPELPRGGDPPAGDGGGGGGGGGGNGGNGGDDGG